MRIFVKAIAVCRGRGCQLRRCYLLVLVACFSFCLVAQSEAASQVSKKNDVCEIAPRLVVLAFVIASLLFLVKFLFSFITSWWSNSRPTSVGRDTPASFGLPRVLLLGGVVGICVGAIAALLATASERVVKHLQAFQVFLPDVALLGLVGALFLAALLQFVYELYFGWRPHGGKLKGQPYKYKVDEIFHRIGVTIGIVLLMLGIIASATLTATSIRNDELSVWQSLNIFIYISILFVTAAIIVYWFTMFVAWVLKGDILILLVIALFALIYCVNWLWRFLTGWFGGGSTAAHSVEPKSSPSTAANRHLLRNTVAKESDKLQDYRDRKFLWLTVFFITFGMILLLNWPLIGAFLLVAGVISMLYYLVYYQNFIWLPVLFVIIGLILLLAWPLWGTVILEAGTVMLAAAAISILYSMTARVAL